MHGAMHSVTRGSCFQQIIIFLYNGATCLQLVPCDVGSMLSNAIVVGDEVYHYYRARYASPASYMFCTELCKNSCHFSCGSCKKFTCTTLAKQLYSLVCMLFFCNGMASLCTFALHER